MQERDGESETERTTIFKFKINTKKSVYKFIISNPSRQTLDSEYLIYLYISLNIIGIIDLNIIV